MYNYTELIDEIKDENNECIICLENVKKIKIMYIVKIVTNNITNIVLKNGY